MSRNRSYLCGFVVFVVGLATGLGLGRLSKPLSAQSTTPSQPSTPRAGDPKPAAVANDDAVYLELSRQYERFAHVNRTFELVARAVSPCVVHIVAKKSGPREDGQVGRYEETGSGVIVRSDSAHGQFILTNHHVVEGASPGEVSIYLPDGRVFRPERVWSDSKADVAVIKLDRNDLPAARLGNSDDLAVGTWVLALGSPFGLTQSVSQGIISARGRYEQELEKDGVEHQEFLQTDAAINPGNSGGPLVNMKGEVVGINTAIASNGGGSEGVGFSIPINLAKWAMTQLVSTGKVSRGAMGVKLQDLTHPNAVALGLERPHGARITSVQDASPAARAGLAVGDVVVRFNGVEVMDFNHLINLVSVTPIGQNAEVVIWRDRKSIAARVAIADREEILAQALPDQPRGHPNAPLRRPSRPGAPLAQDPAAWVVGLELTTIDDSEAARKSGLAETVRGVLVAKVEATSPLAPYLKQADLIQTIGGRPIKTAEEAFKVLSRHPRGSTLEMELQRTLSGSTKSIVVRLP